MCYPMDYLFLFGYQRLKSGGMELTTLYLYMYRYNTILVSKVEGFHIADRGTELRILFFLKHAQQIQVSAFFFFF